MEYHCALTRLVSSPLGLLVMIECQLEVEHGRVYSTPNPVLVPGTTHPRNVLVDRPKGFVVEAAGDYHPRKVPHPWIKLPSGLDVLNFFECMFAIAGTSTSDVCYGG